jgi:hypothetical protein
MKIIQTVRPEISGREIMVTVPEGAEAVAAKVAKAPGVQPITPEQYQEMRDDASSRLSRRKNLAGMLRP